MGQPVVYIVRIRRPNSQEIVHQAVSLMTRYKVDFRLLEPATGYEATVSTFDLVTERESAESSTVRFTSPADQPSDDGMVLVSGFQPPSLSKLSKPANTLIKKISDAAGTLYAPVHTRRMARARAGASITEAKAEIEIDRLRQKSIREQTQNKR